MKIHALEPGEKVLAEIRHHWIFFSLEAVSSFILALLPPLVVYGVLKIQNLVFPSFIIGLLLFVYLIWLLLVWVYFFVAWSDYYLDVLIITDRKVIDIDQKGIFHREVASFRLERIQNIAIETPNFFSTLFDYGHINLETAGEEKSFEMMNAASPYHAKDIIMAECERIKTTPGKLPATDGLS